MKTMTSREDKATITAMIAVSSCSSPSGLLTSAVVASAGVYGVSVSGSEEDWVDVGSGVGVPAGAKTVVW